MINQTSTMYARDIHAIYTHIARYMLDVYIQIKTRLTNYHILQCMEYIAFAHMSLYTWLDVAQFKTFK